MLRTMVSRCVIVAIRRRREINKLYRAHWDGTLAAMAKKARSFSIEIDALNKKTAEANAKLVECEAEPKEKQTNGNRRAVEKAQAERTKAEEALQAKLDERDELAHPPLARRVPLTKTPTASHS